MKTWQDIRLAIGLCNNQDKIDSDFFWNFIKLQRPINTFVFRGIRRHKFHSLNEIVERAYKAKCEKVLFMDIDMRFPLNTIPRLLSHDLPIISGLYFLKVFPFSPIAGWLDKKGHAVNDKCQDWTQFYSPLPKTQNNLVKVDWTGIGCLLVDMKVFESINFPCFRENFSRILNIRTRGHDIIFGEDVKKVGYDIYVDTTVDCVHTPADILINKHWVENFHISNFIEIEEKRAKEYTMTMEYWDSIYAIEKIEQKNRYYKSQYDHVMQFIPENSKIADIGCGRGLFLRVLKEQKKCECFGYDLSQEAINEIQNYGIRGKALDFASYSPNGDESFDFCVVSHVIEHLKDEQIDPFIQNVKKIMKEQAEAFFLVPTFEKRGELWLEHRRIYNQKSLSELLLKYFRNVSIKKIDKGLVAKVNNLPQLTLTE